VQSLSSPRRLGLDTLATAVAGFLGIEAKAAASSSERRETRRSASSATLSKRAPGKGAAGPTTGATATAARRPAKSTTRPQ
jgi:hypothetical protein